MRFTRFWTLALALAPMAAMAGMGGESRRECTPGWNHNFSRHDLQMLDYKKTPSVEALCQQLRENNWCAENCETSQRLRTAFDEVKIERANRAISQREDERKTDLDVQAKAARESELKSGRAKPTNIAEAVITYNAEHGGSLASAPKIRPDGAMYYVHGRITMAGEKPEFFAALSSSQDNELLANVLRRSRGMGESTDYFAVVIPKSLQKYYFDNAKIDSGFDVVGRYVSNTKYKTVAGQEKSAPVFEAVYFDFWSKRQSQTPAAPQKAAANTTGNYEKCIDDAAGAMPGMIECSNKEAARQDARLNTAYKSAMAATADKDGLRSRQRQWIKERDQECALDKDGGQAAVLTSYDCVATKTARRAAELETTRSP